MSPEIPDELQVRRQKTLELVALGYTNNQICARLFRNASTIQNDIKYWFDKTNTDNRAALVHRAWCKGLIDGSIRA